MSVRYTPEQAATLTCLDVWPGEWCYRHGYIWSGARDERKGGRAAVARVADLPVALDKAVAARLRDQAGYLLAAAGALLEAAREGLICAEADVEAQRLQNEEWSVRDDADPILAVLVARRDLIAAAIVRAEGSAASDAVEPGQ